MCGIVGYVGDRNVIPVLLGGLSKLEYRGYDSAGIAYVQDGDMQVIKSKGRLSNLEEKLIGMEASHTLGIGHTRWATHGEPSDINSHPHTNTAGDLAVVHNGIIENYAKIKLWLQEKGIGFISETDTEVIAHLINYFYSGDLKAAFTQAIKMLEGSYALAVISAKEPDKIIATRKDSPLIVGIGEGENIIASDFPALLAYTKNTYLLDDYDVAVVEKEKISIYNKYGQKVKKDIFEVDWDVSQAEKGGWEHFMIKEIHEQPKALYDTLMARLRDDKIDLSEIEISEERMKQIKSIYIVACGSAYHAGVLGKYVIEKIARVPVAVDIASEFRYRDPIIEKDQLVIVISQSGETADTIAALTEAKNAGAYVVAITNVKGSHVSRKADATMYTQAGMEIAVATSKGYLTQVLCLYMIAAELGRIQGKLDDASYTNFIEGLKALPEMAEEVLADKTAIQQLAARRYMDVNEFFVGRGMDYAVMMEGSLKLKELSYIHSETYAAGELKHGPLALIEGGTLVMALLTQIGLLEKTISNVNETKARGAYVVGLAQRKDADLVRESVDELFLLPDAGDLFAPILAAIPYQLYGYYTAVFKGADVDKPRNLAKSVTVE